MKNSRGPWKTLLMATISVALVALFQPQEAAAALQRQGFRVDAGGAKTISFVVPINAQKTWIRIVTDPGIAPLSFDIRRAADPTVTIDTALGNVVKTIPDSILSPLADATYEKNVPATNVHSISLNHQTYRTVTAAENWTIEVHNNSINLGIFAAYLSSVSAAETEGGDVWLRDNATVDPSGYHTLVNINNLDTTAVPTPSEWWKSPSIRFTDQTGTPTKNPVGGQPNNVYIKVHNLGTLSVASVTIEAYWTHFSSSLPAFPGASWNPLGVQTVSSIDPGASRETGTFIWNVPPVPPASEPNHYCIFARTTASVGTLDPVNYSSTVVDWLTPNNTNATHRNVMIIATADPPPAGPFPYFIKPPFRFYLTNPTQLEVATNVRVKGLPVTARASQIMVTALPEERLELEGLEIVAERPPQGTAAAKPAAKTSPAETAAGPIPAGMRAYRITDNERIALSGIRLKPGEKRLMEIQLALAEPVRGPQQFTVDAIQTTEGKITGGVTAVVDIAGREGPPVPGPTEQKPGVPWYVVIALIVIIIILILLLVRKKPAQS